MYIVTYLNGEKSSEFLPPNEALSLFELYVEYNKSVMLFNDKHELVKEYKA